MDDIKLTDKDKDINTAAAEAEKQHWHMRRDKDPRGYRGKRGQNSKKYRENFDKIKWSK